MGRSSKMSQGGQYRKDGKVTISSSARSSLESNDGWSDKESDGCPKSREPENSVVQIEILSLVEGWSQFSVPLGMDRQYCYKKKRVFLIVHSIEFVLSKTI